MLAWKICYSGHMEKESDLEKFAELVVGEMHEMEDRLRGEMHAVEGRTNARMDKFDERLNKIEIDVSEIKDELRGMRQELHDITAGSICSKSGSKVLSVLPKRSTTSARG